MAGIKDIAKHAGVSISTVSYALNGSPKVTEETRKKILAIANELNYIPNAAARNLKKRETRIIGAFFTDYSGSFYGQLLHGMREELTKNGYELIVCTGKQSHRFLPERMIDGAIILDADFENTELLSYAERGHKLVVLDRELEHPNITQVLLDNHTGAVLAVSRLIEAGLKKIYVVTGPSGSYDSIKRLEAVRSLLAQHEDIQYTEISGHFNKESGELAATQITAEYNHPVGIFCFNDEMAIGMYNYFATTKYQIGKEIHLIGFDNIEVSEYIVPRLTTIAYSKKSWGALAAGALLGTISGVEENPRKQIINVNLLEGDSVK